MEEKAYVYEIVESENKDLVNTRFHLKNILPGSFGIIDKSFCLFKLRGARLLE